MARFSLAVGTTTIGARGLGAVMPSGEDAISSLVFQIFSVAGGFSAKPQIAVEGSEQTPIDATFINLATGAVSSAGTAITANGIYALYAPGCQVALTTSAGTATVEAVRIYGRAV